MRKILDTNDRIATRNNQLAFYTNIYNYANIVVKIYLLVRDIPKKIWDYKKKQAD